MNILFLTMFNISNINARDIYSDLMREFVKRGHKIYIVSPAERNSNEKTHVMDSRIDGTDDICRVLRVRVGNLQKTNLLEKGISTLLIESQYKEAIKKYFSNVKFDLVLYSTPPITFVNVIKYVKKRDGACTYLLLKDIFPQNAVDLNMFSKKSPIYMYFRLKEKKLYKISDYIGCMSQANVDYVLKHNPYVAKEIVHISPNSIDISKIHRADINRDEIRIKFGIPQDDIVFIYGGNLGKPQGIPFLIECLKTNENKQGRYFVISGTGTEYNKLKIYFDENRPENMLLINGLPKDEYDELVSACDVGLIFLDHRFTIPNFPSRILAYMQSSMPVLACTDVNTDMGMVIEEGNFGWWCESNATGDFTTAVEHAINADLHKLGKNGFEYLEKNYTVDKTYRAIERVLK